jgi:hypothetical protein
MKKAIAFAMFAALLFTIFAITRVSMMRGMVMDDGIYQAFRPTGERIGCQFSAGRQDEIKVGWSLWGRSATIWIPAGNRTPSPHTRADYEKAGWTLVEPPDNGLRLRWWAAQR